VELTYGNIAANLAAVDHVVRFRPHDVMVGVLPFFHSFGSTITLWAGLTRDVAVAYHHNPLEAQAVGKLVRETGATVLPATPIFLRSYLRRCPAGDFRTLKVVPVGGERLPEDLSDEVAAAFGVRPLEGYGTTEMAPLVSANVPAGRALGEPDEWYRQGTVGRPVPGVRAKVVDLESGAALGAGERGMLLVTGPGLMKGYLGQPAATAAVIKDGWYVTGDVAEIDADGFITLVDRAGRFAKIAGEMVPLGAVDAALLAAVGADEAGMPRAVVTAVPDPARGERLVVLHTALDLSQAEVVRRMAAAGLPKLYLPAAADFFPLETLPVIGAGKLDLQGIKHLAAAATGALSPTARPRQAGPAPHPVDRGQSVA
jgi:acyl-[acyl-carrier-protein]-phospholipid O-acyltransferase/long-chain-fatty-acid--[acyl-carrier-protein] ligase